MACAGEISFCSADADLGLGWIGGGLDGYSSCVRSGNAGC